MRGMGDSAKRTGDLEDHMDADEAQSLSCMWQCSACGLVYSYNTPSPRPPCCAACWSLNFIPHGN